MDDKTIGASLDSWVSDEHKPAREQLGAGGMSPEKRRRALGDLSKHTLVVANSGERHFLLHRSLGQTESKYIKGDTYGQDPQRTIGGRKFASFTSWAPKPVVSDSGLSRPHLVSAWVPESKISFYVPTYVKFIDNIRYRNLARREKEVIVAPGEFKVAHHSQSVPYRGVNLGVDRQHIDRHMEDLSRKLGK
jgi:hypothetical protein